MITDVTIQQLVERIKQFDPEKVILFGSYANGAPKGKYYMSNRITVNEYTNK
jgi:hypothetical protein